MAATRPTSYRLDSALKARIATRAVRDQVTERSLIERLLEESLDMLDHPGIVFRDGPSGRRAALAVGPDVWEVVSALRYTTGTAEERVGVLADQFGVHPRHIRVAIDYAATHRDQIDDRIRQNDLAAAQAEQLVRSRQGLLAS